MRSAVKIALEVTEGQATLLDSQSKIANWLYNQLLERAKAVNWPKFRAWKRKWFSLQYDEPY